MSGKYRCFFFLLGRKAPSRRSSEYLLDFLKVITTAIHCLPSVECQASPTRDVRSNAGGASGGALGRRLSVKQEKKTPCINIIKCAANNNTLKD